MIYGFMGEIGSGKDTACDYIARKYGYEKVAMADNLKQACKIIFSFEDHQLYGTQEQKETPDPRWENVTPRKILQFFGTECMRDKFCEIMQEMGKGIWVKSLEMKLVPGKNYVISDIRFEEEAAMVKRLGGKIVRISRERDNKEAATHSSELSMNKIKYDCFIDNNQSLEHLFTELDRIVGGTESSLAE